MEIDLILSTVLLDSHIQNIELDQSEDPEQREIQYTTQETLKTTNLQI